MVAEKAYLKIIDQSANLFVIQQKTGNGDEGHAVVGNSFQQVQLGKNLRLQQQP